MVDDAFSMKNQKLVDIVVVSFCALIACYYGFHNQFPLVYPDTGTYIHSGFTGQVPLDRPIVYGLFLRHISLGVSPWLVILVQGLIASWLLFKTVGFIATGISRTAILVTTTVLLVFATGFSFNVSILLPDIFCAFAILSMANLLFHNGLNRIESTAMSFLLVISTAAHLSNLPVLLMLLSVFAAIKFIRKSGNPSTWKKIGLSATLTLTAIPMIMLLNVAHGSSARISSISHVFIINHFIEAGILKPYLDENCADKNYTLCNCKDNLSWNFIWSEESCLYDGGGWLATSEEYNQVISDLALSPSYWPVLIQKSLEYGVKQFFSFKTTLSPPQLAGTPPYDHISQRFPNTKREYISSLQNQEKLSVSTINILEEWVVIISLGFLLVVLIYSEKIGISTDLKWFILSVILFSVIGSFVSANLSTVEPRYQNRIVWIFPFLSLLCLPTVRAFLNKSHGG